MRKFWLGFALIFGITLFCYYPSFSHVLRGETYTYWLDTKGNCNAWELITDYYCYEKVRIYDPGDRWLFKPLLFTIVGIEKSVFGVDYIYWRITSFIMHSFAVFSLYRLLWKIKPGLFAISATLFSAVLYTAVNTVLYEQIASYTLFMAFVLNTLHCFYTKKNLAWGVASAVLASLIYEVGIVLVGGYLLYILVWQAKFTQNWKRWAISFGIVLPIYFSFYFAEKLINIAPGTMLELQKLLTVKSVGVGLAVIPNIVWTWVKTLSLPSLYAIVPKFNLRSFSSQIIDYPTGMAFINYISIAGFIIISGNILLRARKSRYQFASLTLLVIAIFLATISIFRTNTHGETYILDNSFNAYMFSIFLIVMLYSAIFSKPTTKLERQSLACFILVPAIMSGFQVVRLNEWIKQSEQPYREYFAYVDSFVQEHKGEQDFTFRVDSPIQDKMKFRLFTVIWNDPPERVFGNYTMTQSLYGEYWDNDNPKYVLEYP